VGGLVGIRYLRVVPDPQAGSRFLDLRMDEMHAPRSYLATVRLHADREAAFDRDHVRDVAAPVLERLACRDADDYVEKALLLERSKALIARALAEPGGPPRFEVPELRFEPLRELVTTTLEPCERPVYRVFWRGEHALTFWLPERESRAQPELAWASPSFRKDPKLRPRALEHGFTYVSWALSELRPLRESLIAKPRQLDLGLPLAHRPD